MKIHFNSYSLQKNWSNFPILSFFSSKLSHCYRMSVLIRRLLISVDNISIKRMYKWRQLRHWFPKKRRRNLLESTKRTDLPDCRFAWTYISIEHFLSCDISQERWCMSTVFVWNRCRRCYSFEQRRIFYSWIFFCFHQSF